MNKIDLSAIDLNLLVVLEVLLDEASVTRASQRLGRTQSAVSHALSRLRDLFGDPLLVRVGTHMRPTPRAENLRLPLAALMRRTEELVFADESFDPATAELRVRLFASDYLQTVVLLPTLAQLRMQAPGIDVEVASPRPDYLDVVVGGDAELALVVNRPKRAGLHYAPLVRDRFVSVAGRARVGRTLTLDTFAALPHALVAPVGRPGGMVDAVLEQHGKRRRIAVVLPHFATALRLVAESELLCTVPERYVDAMDASGPLGLRRLAPPVELPSLELGLVWHERVAHAPAITWVRERFMEVAAQLPRQRPRRPRSRA